ncbi:GatB/YqeY domain-containing protein [Kamptonema cortianum]|uniref:GatB/YqeY domain-containing protein n=1 Tax=Geitlerinema calcuttense NRMC-F 0142 TaxID=2922238 RepID=A0ABT7LY75_9CYAN|nr:GatB/YqeY domain-containing protein [Geitlerinema calcuttense]MDK3157547.1 GatB/YqeY domain-containing protein [Kamptonema cortianum]MDL5056959.1 GatB/YqeY domain-containing protein [Geitlerinema calcuttense NRMC-F 0142]
MSLIQQIDSEIKNAMLARRTVALDTLRMLKSAAKYAAIEQGGASAEVTDAIVLGAVRKQIKMRQDTIASYEQAGRDPQKEKDEIAVLEKFLPVQMSEAELEQIVKATLAEIGATGKKQMGEAMKAVQAKVAGRADGKLVSSLVGKMLS